MTTTMIDEVRTMTRDEYVARWGSFDNLPQTNSEVEEWERDIEAVRRWRVGESAAEKTRV